jgi:hypothetical protein
VKHLLIVDITDDSDRDLPNLPEWQLESVASEIRTALETVYPASTVYVYSAGPNTALSLLDSKPRR